MNKKILISTAITLTLTACAGTSNTWTNEPYVLPKGVPYATLSNALTPVLYKGDSVSITTPLDDCATIRSSHNLRSGVLFSIKDGEAAKLDSIQVPANQPFYIQYGENRKDGRYCYVHVVVNLEQNKNYTLVGGYSTVKGAIPVILDRGGCGLGVVDNATKKIIPHSQDYCPK